MLSLHMGWEHVLFASWPVDPAAVDRRLPDGLTADTYDGDAYLSVVPFTNVDVRPAALPAGVGASLPELNLRTYVRLTDAAAAGVTGAGGVDGTSTGADSVGGTPTGADSVGGTPTDPDAGVYFFSLDADGLAGVAGGRLFHGLPYYFSEIDLRETSDGVRFESRRRHPGARAAAFAARYGPVGEAFTAESGSLDAFLTDRARYFAETSDGDLRYATVTHERWPLYEAEATFHRNDLFAANGFPEPAGDPSLLYSPRVTTRASESRPVAELADRPRSEA